MLLTEHQEMTLERVVRENKTLPRLPAQGKDARRVQDDGRQGGKDPSGFMACKCLPKWHEDYRVTFEKGTLTSGRHRARLHAGNLECAGGSYQQRGQAHRAHELRIPQHRQSRRACHAEMLEPASRPIGEGLNIHRNWQNIKYMLSPWVAAIHWCQ